MSPTQQLCSSIGAFTAPVGYARIKIVQSFDELIATAFGEGFNALCWPRILHGDFREVVERLGAGEGIARIDDARLEALSLSAAGRAARDILLEDQRLLRAHGLAPEVNCIRGYPREEDPEGIATDVYSFHVDSAPVATDTWLCSYYGPATQGLRNDEARRRIDVLETRARLLELFGGKDDDEFQEFLADHCYDLHYAPAPDAQPFSFGLGNLWRIAVEYPGSPVPPCIHRAPETIAGGPPRLLLIS
jgi:hypothetical protein